MSAGREMRCLCRAQCPFLYIIRPGRWWPRRHSERRRCGFRVASTGLRDIVVPRRITETESFSVHIDKAYSLVPGTMAHQGHSQPSSDVLLICCGPPLLSSHEDQRRQQQPNSTSHTVAMWVGRERSHSPAGCLLYPSAPWPPTTNQAPYLLLAL